MIRGGVWILAVIGVGGCVVSSEKREAVELSRQALAASEPVPEAERFAVVLSRARDQSFVPCVMTMLSPTLGLTALSCAADVEGQPFTCDGMGEPSGGGHVLGAVDPLLLTVPVNDMPLPDVPVRARAKRVFTDGANTLCSHDIALVELDQPIVGPVARLRFDKRPVPGDMFSVQGTHSVDPITTGRKAGIGRAAGLVVSDVGPISGTPGGSSVPNTMLAGIGPCAIDTGAPAYVASGAVVGVYSRYLHPTSPVGHCGDPGVRTRYMVVADSAALLRTAFDAVGAMPLLEGHATEGWYALGEACVSDVVCASRHCGAAKTCEVDCTVSGCVGGGTCDVTSRTCAAPATPPASSPSATPNEPEPGAPAASGCTASVGASEVNGAGALLLGLALALACRKRTKAQPSCAEPER